MPREPSPVQQAALALVRALRDVGIEPVDGGRP